ncbi:MAG: hypothetical protein K6G15_00060 [Desulfovibrio sp.]|nr:hypothetical protein [Desulfovibrio sp.]
MRLRNVQFNPREDQVWEQIGKWFGVGIAEAVHWFLEGAPITIIPTTDSQYRIPCADQKELWEWLKVRYRIAGHNRKFDIGKWREICQKKRDAEAKEARAVFAARQQEQEPQAEEAGLECESVADEAPPCAEDEQPEQDRASAHI